MKPTAFGSMVLVVFRVLYVAPSLPALLKDLGPWEMTCFKRFGYYTLFTYGVLVCVSCKCLAACEGFQSLKCFKLW